MKKAVSIERLLVAILLVVLGLTGCGVGGAPGNAAPGAPIDIDGNWQIDSTVTESNVPDLPVGQKMEVVWDISSSGNEVTVLPSTTGASPVSFTRSGNQLTLSDNYFGPYVEGVVNIQSTTALAGSLALAAQDVRVQIDFTGTKQ